MNDSDYAAIEIAVDELTSYVEVVQNAGDDEEKIRWAIRKLEAILLRRPSSPDDNYTSRVSWPHEASRGEDAA